MSLQTRTNVLTAAFIIFVIAVATASPPNIAQPILAYLAIVTGAAAAFFFACWRSTQRASDVLDSLAPDAAADPWATMRQIMRISGQATPDEPVLSKNSVMYGALIFEEVSETILEGLVPALDRAILKWISGNEVNPPQLINLRAARSKLHETAFMMSTAARLVRANIKDLPDFREPLAREEAVPLFDGVTDTIVVTCGLTIASGLPGAAGYDEVAGSNLSKANPDTGRIDKTPDGKWIKGRNYVSPDLGRILDERDGPAAPCASVTPA